MSADGGDWRGTEKFEIGNWRGTGLGNLLSQISNSFWMLTTLSLLGYLLLFRLFPLIPAYNQVPLSDVRTFTPSLTAGFGYGALLIGLYGLYGLAYRALKRGLLTVTLSQILVTTAVFGLILALRRRGHQPGRSQPFLRRFLDDRIVILRLLSHRNLCTAGDAICAASR